MNTRPVRVALVGVVASLVLGGCGADEASPDAPADASPGASDDTRSAGAVPGQPGRAKDRDTHRTKDQQEDRREDRDRAAEAGEIGEVGEIGEDEAGGATQPDPGASSGDEGTAAGSAPALEMPEAPEPAVSSLSELLPPTDPAPLVTTPLPGAANAQGRLVRRFPSALRPTRAARVVSSSLSPSGDRLQVGLVATTSLSPAQVLLSYRARLARRGVGETATPPSVAGSRAAAFRQGDSVVTVTVTPRGSGTSYSVHASLLAGRG